jgi:hypothetical protein
MTPELLAATEAALDLILRHASQHLRETVQTRKALTAGSPMFPERFARLCEHAAPDLPTDVRAQVAETLAELTPTRRGPASRGYTERTTITLRPKQAQALAAYCAREEISGTEAVRRGLALLVPEWPGPEG